MSLIEIFSIIFIHFLADFCLQTDKQAKGKSKNWSCLLSHTFDYSMCWFIVGLIFWFSNPSNQNWAAIVWFFLITFTAHTITDYFTSRINKKLWEQGKTHLFFVSVGFDQVLHYVQLFLTYQLLR